MRRVIRKGLCCYACMVLLSASARAQSLADAAARAKEQKQASGGSTLKLGDFDVDPQLAAKEVLNYEVSAERWRRFETAVAPVERLLEKDAALLERLTALKVDTARGLERFIAREPALMRVLTAAGTDAHDFAFTQIALTVAMVLNEDQRVAANKEQLPPATQANMELVRAHERELKQLQAMATALKAGMDK